MYRGLGRQQPQHLPPRGVLQLTDAVVLSYVHAAILPRAYNRAMLGRLVKQSQKAGLTGAAAAAAGGGGRRATDFPSPRINSMDFHTNGSLLATADDLGGIRVYNNVTCELSDESYVAEEGVHLLRFAQNANQVLFAPRKTSRAKNEIQCLSLYDNTLLRYFRGHVREAHITDMAISPLDDTFVSADSEGGVLMWDMKSPAPIGYTSVVDPVIARAAAKKNSRVGKTSARVAYDPSGVVFAVARGGWVPTASLADAFGLPLQKRMISLYDARNFRSPFLTWNSDDRWPLYGDKLASAGPGGRTGESLLDAIIFSPDSQRIAQISAHPHIPHVIIDAMKGDVKMVIPTVGKEIMTENKELPTTYAAAAKGGCAFSPDSQYFYASSIDGGVDVWSLKAEAAGATYKGKWQQRHSGCEVRGGILSVVKESKAGEGGGGAKRKLCKDMHIPRDCLRAHPRGDLVATGNGSTVVFWKPSRS